VDESDDEEEESDDVAPVIWQEEQDAEEGSADGEQEAGNGEIEAADNGSEAEDSDEEGEAGDWCAGDDLHAMLRAMLASYKNIEQRGFYWDLRYQGTTTRHHFVPHVMFIKGDSVEHDHHCGHFSSRTQGIKQIC
jgi:hypothetical protein